MISLIGHYEKIARYLLHNNEILQNPGAKPIAFLRLKARSPWSLMQACLVVAWHAATRRKILIGLPRSNSRAIKLLSRIFFRAHYFTYSDGLGDAIHSFFMENSVRYIGHVGFSGLSHQPLIHEIPLFESVENWGRFIQFNDLAPVLVIVKSPKETTYDQKHLARLYIRSILSISRHRSVILSGSLHSLSIPATLGVRLIGPLAQLEEPLEISSAVGLPSTAFLTLATKLPIDRLRVMRLCCGNHHPDANRRINSMKQTLDHCIARLSLHV